MQVPREEDLLKPTTLSLRKQDGPHGTTYSALTP
jgi:hypothetical protein